MIPLCSCVASHAPAANCSYSYVMYHAALMCLVLFVTLACFIFFFFFQAEDGIRDLTVTGVQTCALPIYRPHPTGHDVEFRVVDPRGPMRGRLRSASAECLPRPVERRLCLAGVPGDGQIGRASCRERV